MAQQGKGFPWYVKAVILLAALAVVFVIAVDLLQIANTI
jgi:hypothetical protein